MSHHAHVEQDSVCQHNQYLHKFQVTYMNCQPNVFSFYWQPLPFSIQLYVIINYTTDY